MRAYLLVTVLVAAPAALLAQDYDAPRNATVNASGATTVRVDARAGLLRITGRPGISEVRVQGTARASSRGLLDDIKVEAVRNGNDIEVRAILPEQRGSGFNGDWEDYHALLDLVVEVPAAVALDIEDTSGDIVIESVTGKVRVEDNSGNIRIRDAGELWISDSSGGIDVRGVKGSVEIDEDSSGEIEIYDVSGTVHVRRDSSGSIDVSHVGGDFIVDRDGSGSIDYSDVKGKVEVPEPRRGARRYR